MTKTSLAVILTFATVACGKSAPPAQNNAPAAAPAGPVTIDAVRVVEQPVNVTLSMPGELDPYEIVAVYPRVAGFVKSIAVDRGSRVRTGDVLVVLEAPELAAQRAEAQSKLQAANAQVDATRARADAEASTYDKLKSASALQASSRATTWSSRRRTSKRIAVKSSRRSRTSKPRVRR